MPCKSPCLLITATISPHKDMVFTVRTDVAVRLNDYAVALEHWLKHDAVRDIVFVENSDHNIEPLRQIATRFPLKRVEFLSFAVPTYNGSLGKGYGEMFCLEHALKNSHLLREHTHLVKVSGRYSMRNLDDLLIFLRTHCELDALVLLRQRLTWADSRVFGASIKFVQDVLLPRHHEINDSTGIYFEHVLARAVHQMMAGGGRWETPPTYMQIEGIQGTNGKAFRSSPVHYYFNRFVYSLLQRYIWGAAKL
jgi:hypothetical protein